MSRTPWLIFALVLCAVFSPRAQAEMVSAENVPAILDLARGVGTAELTEDSQGRPVISARSGRFRYLILFYDCRALLRRDADALPSCRTIQFGALWEARKDDDRLANIARANEWNRRKRLGSAYVDPDGALLLTAEANLGAGVDRRSLSYVFESWSLALNQFPDFMNE